MQICSFRFRRRISRGRRRGFGSSIDYSMLPLRNSVIQGRRLVLLVSADADLARVSRANSEQVISSIMRLTQTGCRVRKVRSF